MAQIVNQPPLKSVASPAVVEAALKTFGAHAEGALEDFKVPYPNPVTKAQKEANGVVRNKRKAAAKAAKLEAKLAAMTPEERQAYDEQEAALKTVVNSLKTPVPAVDEDKPVISYDNVGGDHVAESYCSDNTPGVAAGVSNDNDPSNDTGVETAGVAVATESAPVVFLNKKEKAAAKRAAKAAKKAAKAIITTEDETRNGEPPVEVVSQAEPEQPVDDALAEHGSFKEADKAAEKEKTDANGAIDADSEAVDEQFEEQPAKEPVAEPSVNEPGADITYDGTSSTAQPEPVVEPVSNEPVNDSPPVVTTEPPVIEAKKPTLKIVSGNPNDPKVIAAKKFYGDTFTAERSELLTKALFWLDKAIEAELAGDAMKLKLAWKAARKNEAEALGYKADLDDNSHLAMAA